MNSVTMAVTGQFAESYVTCHGPREHHKGTCSRGFSPPAPGPPVRLVFPEVRLTSVRTVWQPPEEPNGVILGKGVAGWRGRPGK